MSTSKKRGREEDEDVLRHYAPDTKRSTLPFRASPNTRHIRHLSQSRSRPAPLFAQTITPADSSEEENSPPLQSPYQCYLQYHPINVVDTTLQNNQNGDSDMDMTDSLPLLSPKQWVQIPHTIPHTPSPQTSPCTMEFQLSESKSTQNNATGGRLPTPIYGHFQRSIDARMDAGANPETQASRLQQDIDYETYIRRRRLPTPIDEDEDMESSTAMSGNLMDLHLSGPSRRGGIDYTYDPQIFGSAENRSAYPSTPEAPQRKPSFSMGPRANCELCMRRIPGHSNHIIRS